MADVKIRYVQGRWRKVEDKGTHFLAELLTGKHKGDRRLFRYMEVEKVYVKRPKD